MKLAIKILVTALLIALTGLLFSCDIYKESLKDKQQSNLNEQIESKIVRKGDTVTFQVPKITFKDTTIYRVNRQGTVLKTVYDNKGQISQIDCFASAIEEIRKENRSLVESLKHKEAVKKEEVNTTVFLYFFGAIALVICFGFLLMFFYMQKNTKALTAILEKVTSSNL
jgi:hypothetical protein